MGCWRVTTAALTTVSLCGPAFGRRLKFVRQGRRKPEAMPRTRHPCLASLAV